MSMMWVTRERTITERGVILPFTLPERRNQRGEIWREERSGEAFVEDEILIELTDTSQIGPVLILDDKEVEQALLDAGWIHKLSRGGVYASAPLRSLMEGESR